MQDVLGTLQGISSTLAGALHGQQGRCARTTSHSRAFLQLGWQQQKHKRGSRHEVGLQMGSQASHPSAPVSRPPPAQWPQADHLVRCMCAAALAVVTASTADLHRTGA